MFDIIKKFVSDLSVADEPEAFIHDKMQLAEAALMYHVIAVDGVIRDEEKAKMAELLSEQFDLSEEETKSLTIEAKTAEQEAIDLYKFTSILKRALKEEDRIKIIEHLWEMVFADGVLHELEDNVVWRIAELLAVDSRNRVLLKQRVWKKNSQDMNASTPDD
jgi:uncharacterized tellurite resistance protein B-like protein